MDLPLTEDFREIVLSKRPLIDVRAPIEFQKGSFPHTINLPLMNDEERRLIGIRYKNNGNAAAVALGKELIDGQPRAIRTKTWKSFVQSHPDAYLFCFRGGQRSQISQTWLAEAGYTVPRIKGGYKAFRYFLTQESERIAKESSTCIIGGRTGSGKTLLLAGLPQSIDLEKFANHRGSSFGHFLSAQPSQIDFENTLAYALIQHEAAGYNHLIIEHESKNIGKRYIPKPVFEALQKGALLILETPLHERVEITFDEYVTKALQNYHDTFGFAGAKKWFDDANTGLDRIQRRLGGQLHKELKAQFSEAFHTQQNDGSLEAHKAWIAILLEKYYDPMYDYQIKKSTIPIIFRGNQSQVMAYLNDFQAAG